HRKPFLIPILLQSRPQEMQPVVTIPPSGNEPKTTMNPLIFAAYLAAVVALFVADVLTPRGATPVIGYCVMPLLAVQTRRRWFILGIMGLCTVLTWAAYFLEPPGVSAWVLVFERIMVTSVLWFSFVLVWQQMLRLSPLGAPR